MPKDDQKEKVSQNPFLKQNNFLKEKFGASKKSGFRPRIRFTQHKG